jgi:hypothetical protein
MTKVVDNRPVTTVQAAKVEIGKWFLVDKFLYMRILDDPQLNAVRAIRPTDCTITFIDVQKPVILVNVEIHIVK